LARSFDGRVPKRRLPDPRFALDQQVDRASCEERLDRRELFVPAVDLRNLGRHTCIVPGVRKLS
jgi:hypothetical protein